MVNITLDKRKYEDKVRACWVGKNIGGTMGAPYEGQREVLDIKGFATAPGVVLPNDDLDLQLVWLYALEQNGPYAINSQLLGEHWISFIVPHWNEYGIGKANMKRGIQPPMSGDFDNDWRDSNGAWIRTEIWATVAPAMPHVAARYAMEDAMVDHGAGEGTFAAAFVAAMQSAAFVIPDLKRCIEIGLASIPEKSRMTKSIKFVLECYESGMSWLDARNAVQKLNADIGNGWFEAPSNVTYAVIGLLWGEGDFKKSMITAINCGDDTDCTGATVGATMGILYGMAGIPTDWAEHIGDEIVTISLNRAQNGRHFPKACTELTRRIVRQAPSVLLAHSTRLSNLYCPGVSFELGCELGDSDEIPEDIYERFRALARGRVGKDADSLKPYTVYASSALMNVALTLEHEPVALPLDKIGVRLTLNLHPYHQSEPKSVKMRWITPDGFTVSGRRTLLIHDFNPHSYGRAECDFVINVPESVEAESRMILEILPEGRISPMYISFLLLG